MMVLARQQWRDRRTALAGWLAGWTVLVGMYVAAWPTVRAHGSGAFSSPGGYLTAELLGVTGPLVAVTMGVLLGVGCLARDEEDGTLELLLAQPVSRTRLLLSRTGAGLLEIVAVLLLASLALWLLGLAVGLGIGLAASARALLMLALLSAEGLALSVLFGAVLGRAARARALAGAVGLVAFLLAALGPSIDGLHSAVRLSPFHTLVASDPFRQVPGVLPVAVLLLPTVVMVAVAVLAFQRRDLRLR